MKPRAKQWTIAALILSLSAGFAFADEIADRQALMKSNGRALGSIGPILKGEKPFDQAIVDAALKTLSYNATAFDADKLFPESSKTGGDTEASPKIWEDMAGFKHEIDEFREATAAAVAAHPTDVDSLKARVGAIGKECGGCHQTYRLKKS